MSPTCTPDGIDLLDRFDEAAAVRLTPAIARDARRVLTAVIAHESAVPGVVGVRQSVLLDYLIPPRDPDLNRCLIPARDPGRRAPPDARLSDPQQFRRAIAALIDLGFVREIVDRSPPRHRQRGHQETWYISAPGVHLTGGPVPDLDPIAREILEKKNSLDEYHRRVQAACLHQASRRPVEHTKTWLDENGRVLMSATRTHNPNNTRKKRGG